jgi:hypothetical protein
MSDVMNLVTDSDDKICIYVLNVHLVGVFID